ncbi:MAG TPA: ribosome silencing factor [Opitutales bacterium]|nr:ribosome silencing factor [Opitutales bacterium]
MKLPKEGVKDPKLELVGLSCRTLDEKNAQDIRIIDVQGLSSITDYFIIATGTSEPHLHALTKEIAYVLKKEGYPIVGHEMRADTGWTVLDAHDVVIHLFVSEMREHYQLDSLWKDGKTLDLSLFVEAPAPAGQQRGR